MLRKHKDEIKKKIIVNKSLLTLSLFDLDYVISVMEVENGIYLSIICITFTSCNNHCLFCFAIIS